MILDKIVLSQYQPAMTNVMWVKPVGKGLTFYMFNNGEWKAVKIVDDKETAATSDDTIVDINGIERSVKEIIKYIDENALSLADSTDDTEYELSIEF